jgi:hypothetical protein
MSRIAFAKKDGRLIADLGQSAGAGVCAGA